MSYLEKLKSNRFHLDSQVFGPRDRNGIPEYSVETFANQDDHGDITSSMIIGYSDKTGGFWSYYLRGELVARSRSIDEILGNSTLKRNLAGLAVNEMSEQEITQIRKIKTTRRAFMNSAQYDNKQ